MLVAEILKDKGGAVFTIAPTVTMAQACGELKARRVGALIVCDGDKVVGILSERDVVRAISKDAHDSLSREVAVYMTNEVIFADLSETVAVLMGRMTENRIRHLPVLTDGRLTGVISIGDVVKCQIAEATHEAEQLRTYIAAG